jgi:pimeloyl-ACP methyl ester carboxylesterase
VRKTPLGAPTQNQNDLDQYLQQRVCFEANWLAAMNTIAMPATIVWGQEDPVCPSRVGQYVWDASLSVRSSAPARYIKSPK